MGFISMISCIGGSGIMALTSGLGASIDINVIGFPVNLSLAVNL